jgi:hypothetical protein
MNTNPINLAVRFLLELIMLFVLCLWGWHLGGGWVRYVYAILFPVAAATLWGVFRIQNDPKPAPVETPGVIRLLLELGLFTLTVSGLHSLGYAIAGWVIATIVVIHYLVSYDRTLVMLRNKPYRGFVKD